MLSLPLVIIAGGKSSRMGSDKSLLPFGAFPTLTQYQLSRFKHHFSSLHVSCKTKDKFDFEASFIEDNPLYPESSPLVALGSILEHFDAMLKFHGPHGAIMFRKLLHSYSKGYTGANEFRDIINKISDVDVMRDMIESFF